MSLFEPDAIDIVTPAEHVPFDEVVGPAQSITRLKKKTLGSFSWLSFAAAVCAIVLIARLTDLQVVHGATYQARSRENHVRFLPLTPVRGLITDRNGAILAANTPSFDILAIPADLPRSEEDRMLLQQSIVTTLGISVDVPLATLPLVGNHPTTIFHGLNHEQALLAMTAAAHWQGINILESEDRIYPTHDRTAHTVGTMGKLQEEDLDRVAMSEYRLNDRIGQSGLESVYETELRGKSGYQEVEIDSFGHIDSIRNTSAPQSGLTLRSSIDATLQEVATASLEKQLARAHVRKGSVVGIDPRNGKVRILVSAPSFDNEAMTKGISPELYQQLSTDVAEPLFNKALGGLYPPGSTFKPFVAVAALMEQVIYPETKIFDGGKITVGPWEFKNYSTSGRGYITLREAIAYSINVFFYVIGGGYQDRNGLGAARIKSYAQDFGFGSPTGVALGGEGEGLLPDPQWKEQVKNETWFVGDTYHMAIGQGDVLVTPLQLAMAYGAIANGGTLYRPQLVEAWRHADASEDVVAPEVVRTMDFDPSVFTAVQQGMAATVDIGTARRLQSVPMKIAGKTGTAEYIIPNGNGKTGLHAWFAGYAPREQPSLVLIVLLEGAGEGSDYAVPVAQDIFAAYAAQGNP